MGEFSRLNSRYNPAKSALLGLVFILGCLFLSSPSAVGASTFDTKVRVRVVPLECIIEEINNGVTEEYFLGPSECEDLINPPIITPPDHVPADTGGGNSNDRPATTDGRENQVFLAPFAGQTGESDADKTNPATKQPLIKLGDYEFLTSTFSKVSFFLFSVIFVLFATFYLLGERIRLPLSKIFGVWWRR
jgi:hypothetical protein